MVTLVHDLLSSVSNEVTFLLRFSGHSEAFALEFPSVLHSVLACFNHTSVWYPSPKGLTMYVKPIFHFKILFNNFATDNNTAVRFKF